VRGHVVCSKITFGGDAFYYEEEYDTWGSTLSQHFGKCVPERMAWNPLSVNSIFLGVRASDLITFWSIRCISNETSEILSTRLLSRLLFVSYRFVTDRVTQEIFRWFIPVVCELQISNDKVGEVKHKKTLLRYRSQKKDNMFRPFYYNAIIRSDMENWRGITMLYGT
jgi:hypothetical protein